MTDEEKRAEHDKAWWATYRAALGGIHTNPETGIDEAHDLAVMAADKAHGQRVDGAEI
jgi:hypothetical protein